MMKSKTSIKTLAARTAMTLFLAVLTTAAAWATTTSTITVGGTDYTLFTGFTATGGNGTNYAKLVDGNTSTDWSATKSFNNGDPNAPAGDFNGGTEDPAFVEFHADEAFIPKGYILTCDHENAGFWKPVEWALKAKLNEGDDWTTIHSSTTTLGAGKTFEIACDNDGDNQYQYFRFEVYEVGATTVLDLDELQFYGSLPAYTHLTVKAATCMETGIKQDCYRRNSDGKYFTDETGTTELTESDVIAPIIPHTGEHHDATDVNIEYWQCSMCSKYFSDEDCTTEITEEDTKIYRTITIDNSISGLVTVGFGKTQALAGENVLLRIMDDRIDISTLKVNDGAVEVIPDGGDWYKFTMPAADVTVTAEVAQSNVDGDILTGSIKHRVTITDGASITLNNATISGSIVCEGTATITLVGTNSVSGATNKAGIQIGGSGTTLTIRGDGLLTVTGGDWGAGIGLSAVFNYDSNVSSGDIVIEGGTITATGGSWGAGIGTGVVKNTNNDNTTSVQFGTITIKGGSVTATGGTSGDGIGKGYSYSGPTISIGTVTIYDGIDKVDASSITNFGNVVYMHVDGETETNVTASKADHFTIIEDGNRRIIVQKVNPAIAEIPDQTYTGSEITPEPLVIAGSLSLTKDEDYTYSYTNNTNVGTATVRATFQGTYASLGYVEKTFNIVPSTIMVSVAGGGTVTIGDKSASDGEAFGVMSAKGASVVLTLAPDANNAVRSVAYGYTNSKGTNISGRKLPISDGTATLTVPNDLKDGTGVTLTVTFAAALVGGDDEASAVALTDATVTDLAGGWYKVESDITFDHTLNLLGDTHLTIASGATMTVTPTTGTGIDSDYTLTVGGAGALSVTASGSYPIAVRVGSYVQTGATVTASGFIGIRCYDNFDADVTNDFTFSGGQLTVTGNGGDGIRADNDITISCTNASDFIQSSSYDVISGTVKVADGKALTDGTNIYSGTLTDEQRTAIGGKTLHRAVTTSYVDASGTLHENVIAIPLDDTMTTLAAGWYVVNSDVAYTGTVTLSDDVKLILGDGCTMSFGKEGELLNATIMECNNHNLTIYGQSGGTGWLKAYSAQYDGINNVNYYTQYSGNVVIRDGNDACIDAREFTILGGTLDVESGGGAYGEIIVTTGNINIRGGKLWAKCKGLKTMIGMIILDYTNATDQIRAYSYQPQNGLQIADGKTLVDEYGGIWSGTLDNNQIEHGINDRTLKPFTKTALTITADSDTKNYDGTALTKNSYTYTGLVEGDVISSVTVTGSQTNVGSSNNVPSAAVIKDANNVDVTDCYSITYVNGTLTVTACQSTDAIVALTIPEGGYTYDGTEKQPAVTVTIGNATVEGTEYTVSYADNVNAGTATVTIEDNPGGNYAFAPLSTTFEIGKATLTPIAVTITGWKYGDTANSPTIGEIAGNGTVTYTYADNKEGDYTETVPTATGTHWVKASVAETTNYNAAESAAVSFKITKKPLTDKEVEVSISKDNDEYTVTVKHGESTLEEGESKDYTLDNGTTNPDTNDYTVKVSATENGNYTGEVDVTYIGVKFSQPGADDNTSGQSTEDVDCYAAAQVSQDMALPEGMVAVMITSIDPTTGVASAKELDYMPKDVPFILMKKGDTDGFTAKDVTPGTDSGLTELSESDKNANKLEVAGEGGTDLTAYQDYIWFKGELVLVSGGQAKKGDFFVKGGGSGSSAPRLSIVIEEGETTSLGLMHNSQCIMHNDNWYSIDGKKQDKQPTKKGLYINKGKKVVVK